MLAPTTRTRTVRDTAEAVTIELARGRGTFDVHRRPGRRFTVVAGEVSVVVIGTRFSVAREDGRVTVEVERGRVEVRRGDEVTTLVAGEEWSGPAHPDPVVRAAEAEPPREALAGWLSRYAARCKEAPRDRIERMNRVNPKYVFRNYLAQLAIDALEKDDTSVMERLLMVLELFRKLRGQLSFRRKPARRDGSGGLPRVPRQWPLLECLEDRLVPATFYVDDNFTAGAIADADLDFVESAATAMGESIRMAGVCGPAVDVPEGADRTTRVLGYLGRQA